MRHSVYGSSSYPLRRQTVATEFALQGSPNIPCTCRAVVANLSVHHVSRINTASQTDNHNITSAFHVHRPRDRLSPAQTPKTGHLRSRHRGWNHQVKSAGASQSSPRLVPSPTPADRARKRPFHRLFTGLRRQHFRGRSPTG